MKFFDIAVKDLYQIFKDWKPAIFPGRRAHCVYIDVWVYVRRFQRPEPGK